MTARLEYTQFEGFPAYVLENDVLRIVVLPELGGKIISLLSLPTGREWLWRNPHLPLRRPPTHAGDFGPCDSGGWDEIFPTINPCVVPDSPWGNRRLTDHGELWHQPWHVEFANTTDDGAALLTLTLAHNDPPFQFTRSLLLPSAELKLELNYKLVNHGERPLPYIWATHPLFAVRPGDRLVLPPGTPLFTTSTINLNVADYPLRFNWPCLSLSDGSSLDFSRVPEPSANFAAKLFAESLKIGSVEIISSKSQESIALHWNPASIPHVGLWINYGAWSGTDAPHYFNLGIEPTSSPSDNLASNPPRQNEALAAIETRCWGFVAALEHDNSLPS